MKTYRDDLPSLLKAAEKIEEFAKYVDSTDQTFYQNTRDKMYVIMERCAGAAAVLGQYLRSVGYVSQVSTLESSELASAILQEPVMCRAGAELTIPNERRYAFRQYANVLQNPVILDKLPPASKTCAELLKKWFVGRFIDETAGQHFYKIMNLPDFIFAFVLAFGAAAERNEELRFEAHLDGWLQQVKTNPAFIWSLPPDVFNIYSATDKAGFVTNMAYDIWEDMKAVSHSKLFTDRENRWPLDPNAISEFIYNGPEALRTQLYDRYLYRLSHMED